MIRQFRNASPACNGNRRRRRLLPSFVPPSLPYRTKRLTTRNNCVCTRTGCGSNSQTATPWRPLWRSWPLPPRTREPPTRDRSFIETGPWWVAAVRNASTVVFVHPPFRALSIEGHPNPTSVSEAPFGILALRSGVQARAESRGASYIESWVDAADVTTSPPPGGRIVLQPILQQRFDAMPVSPLPVLTMESEVERVFAPIELEFLRTFVTTDEPPQPFTIVGQRPAAAP
jgi:hypothetical protein